MSSFRGVFYGCLICILILLLSHEMPAVRSADVKILAAAQSCAGKTADVLVGILALIGGPYASVVALGMISVVLFFKYGRIREILLFWVLFFVLTAFEFFAKMNIPYPRPGKEYMRKVMLSDIFERFHLPHLGIPGMNSFPSGHCLRAVLLTGVLAIALWPRARWGKVMVVLAVGVYWMMAGWSRLYLGVHWPIDVWGGYLLGIAVLTVYLSSLAIHDLC